MFSRYRDNLKKLFYLNCEYLSRKEQRYKHSKNISKQTVVFHSHATDRNIIIVKKPALVNLLARQRCSVTRWKKVVTISYDLLALNAYPWKKVVNTSYDLLSRNYILKEESRIIIENDIVILIVCYINKTDYLFFSEWSAV